MFKFFKHKKTGRVISREEYINKTFDNIETNTSYMAETGSDLDANVFGSQSDYDPYDLQEDGDIQTDKN